MANNFNKLCDYGCENKAKYQFKNGKWCCSQYFKQCPNMKRWGIPSGMKGKKLSEETKQHLREINTGENNPNYGKKRSEKTKRKQSEAKKGKTYEDLFGKEESLKLRKRLSEIKKGKKVSKETRKKQSESLKGKSYEELYGKRKADKIRKLRSEAKKGQKNHWFLTIERLKKIRPFFSQIEAMRYNPDKPAEKELQVHCKNHLCKNSKEQGGWFTPSRIQLGERIRCLEIAGTDNSYFYCSDECKHNCLLYASKGGDPFKIIVKPYTSVEYQTFRKFVLERDNNLCEFCGKQATDVHHERPQKLEPFFALDPDFAWSCCEKCHYEKGHKDECSTGNLAKKQC